MEDDNSFAHVAQSVEHFLGKEEVAGSIPVMSTTRTIPAGVDPVSIGLVFLSHQFTPSGFSAYGKG